MNAILLLCFTYSKIGMYIAQCILCTCCRQNKLTLVFTTMDQCTKLFFTSPCS